MISDKEVKDKLKSSGMTSDFDVQIKEEKLRKGLLYPLHRCPMIIEDRNGVKARLLPHKMFFREGGRNKTGKPNGELDLPWKLLSEHSHWLVLSNPGEEKSLL